MEFTAVAATDENEHFVTSAEVRDIGQNSNGDSSAASSSKYVETNEINVATVGDTVAVTTDAEQQQQQKDAPVLRFGGKYCLLREQRIGSGSFGEIFLCQNIRSGEQLAVKVEYFHNNTPTSADTAAAAAAVEKQRQQQQQQRRRQQSQLRREAKVYRLLQGAVGFPRVRAFCDCGEQQLLVMDLLGSSLEQLFNFCGRRFSLRTVLVLAYELISRIETVHSRGLLVHRDIKPENFLMGRGRQRHTVFLIDFGLAKRYCSIGNNNSSDNSNISNSGSSGSGNITGDAENKRRHIKCRGGHSLTGTARYASTNAHQGLEQSRRDDMLSIGYVLLYFLRGVLPWQGLRGRGCDSSSDDKYRRIFEKKKHTSFEELCAGQPAEFLDYFRHVSQLSFEQAPDYARLKQLFKGLFQRMRFTYDQHALFDWEVIAAKQQQQKKQVEQQQP